jgi:8-oxo-dGTP pyrophosphatase MutT (NUDIX family)
MSLIETIRAYRPGCAQEMADRQVMLAALERGEDLLTRENLVMHFTASAWIVNPPQTKVLMVYHNLYDSWAWTGGHADGEEDLLKVALREAEEETGARVQLLRPGVYSLETLTVNPHLKRGKYVPAHLHLNLTYLLEADESDHLAVKPDENRGVAWFTLSDAVAACSEPWMRPVYEKLNARLDPTPA